MEFSLGLLGGLGMIYGIYSREWPETVQPSRRANWLALLFVVLFVPLTNISMGFEVKRFVKLAEQIGRTDTLQFAHNQIWLSIFILVFFLILVVLTWRKYSDESDILVQKYVPIFLMLFTTYYIIYSHLVKGVFFTGFTGQIEQLVYWVILLIIFILWLNSQSKKNTSEASSNGFSTFSVSENYCRWSWILGGLLVVLAILTIILISVHDGLGGIQKRF